MVEQRRNRQEQERRRNAISKLSTSEVFRDIFKYYEVKADASHRLNGFDLGQLDLWFAHKNPDTRQKSVRPIDMFGLKNCVGIILGEDPDSFWRKESLAREQTEKLGIPDAHIAFISPDDIPRWIEYYQQIGSLEEARALGPKADELSGLTRVSSRYHKRAFLQVLEILSNSATSSKDSGYFPNEALQSQGVVEFNRVPLADDCVLDIGFLDKSGQLIEAEIFNLRRGTNEDGSLDMEGEILLETVIQDGLTCIGMVVVGGGREDKRCSYENKREAYKRAARIEEEYFNQTGQKAAVGVVTLGQVSLFQKLGWAEPLITHYPTDESSLTTQNLVSSLFLGNDNLRRGVLAPYMSLPNVLPQTIVQQGRLPVDLSFGKHLEDGQIEITTSPVPLVGIDLSKWRGKHKDLTIEELVEIKDELPTMPISDVAGIVILPDSLNKHQIKKYIDGFRRLYADHTKLTKPNFLVLTPLLWQDWLEQGTCIADEAKVKKAIDSNPKRAAMDYGLGVGESEVETYFAIWRERPAVGGGFTAFIEVTKELNLVNIILTNAGTNFKAPHPFMNTIEGQSSVSQGLEPYLRRGAPALPIYSPDWILANFENNSSPCVDDPDDLLTMLMRGMLHNAIVTDQESRRRVKDFLGDTRGTRKMLRLAKRDWKEKYQELYFTLSALVLSHAHVDHAGLLPILAKNAWLIASGETGAMVDAITLRQDLHQNKLGQITEIADPVQRNPYPAYRRPQRLLYRDSDRVKLSENIEYHNYQTGHSMPSVLGVFDMGDYWFGDGGDWRIDDQGKTLKAVEAVKGKLRYFLTEITNGPNSKKPSLGKTEADVSKFCLMI